MTMLTLEETLVLKALARRENPGSYARLRMQSLDRRRVSDLIRELHRIGFVEARRDESDEWLAGPITTSGKHWLTAYGLTFDG